MPELKIKKQLSSSNADELARLQEDTERQLVRERVPDQENFINADRQRGIPLEANNFIRRVQLMNPLVWAEDSRNYPGYANFYFVGNHGKQCTVTPFRRDVVFEFCRIYVDARKRPIKLELGWREILHRLAKLRLIRHEQIKRFFPIYSSARSEAFERYMQELNS